MVSRGADINAVDNEGNTPLMKAVPGSGILNVAWEGVVYPVVKMLFALGANPFYQNKKGQTAKDILLASDDKEDPWFKRYWNYLSVARLLVCAKHVVN